MIDPTELRRLAEAATPGGWTASGTIVWSLDAKSVVAAASATETSSGLVEYERPKLSGIIQPSRNAAYIAAANPQTTLALLDRLAKLEALLEQARMARTEYRALLDRIRDIGNARK